MIAEKVYDLVTPTEKWEEHQHHVLLFWKVRVIIAFHLLLGNIYVIRNLLHFDLNENSWRTFVIDHLIFDYQILALLFYSILMLTCLNWGWSIMDVGLSRLIWKIYAKVKRLAVKIFVDREEGVQTLTEAFVKYFQESGAIINNEGKLFWADGKDGVPSILKRIEFGYDNNQSYFNFLKWLVLVEMMIFMWYRPEFFPFLVKLFSALFFIAYTIWLPMARFIGFLIRRFRERMDQIIDE